MVCLGGVGMKAGWQTKKLSEVSDVFDGPHATPKTVDAGPIFLGIGALQDGVINLSETRHVTDADFKQWTRRVRPQAMDVVFSYETRLGQAAIIPEGLDCCLGRRMGLVRLDRAAVVPRFFLYQYVSPQFREFLDSKTIRGATVDRISIKDFPSFPIAVPPLPEQHRIVTLLDEAFDGIATARANAEQNLQNAHALFESHLQSVFSKRGDGWVEKSLEELGTITSSKRIFKSEYVEVGVPFYRTKEIKELANDRQITTELFISKDRYQEIKTVFGVPKAGDILLTAIGTIGEIWVVDGEADFYFKDGNVLWLKEFTSVNPQFLRYVLLSFVDSLNKMSHGSAYSALPIQRLNVHRIFLPPLAAQEQIVTTLDVLREETQRLESIYQRKLAALDALKKSLLHQAFSGQL